LEGRDMNIIMIVQSPEPKIPGFRPAVWLDSVFAYCKINLSRAVSPRVKKKPDGSMEAKKNCSGKGFYFR
jgi:hypothetical protein